MRVDTNGRPPKLVIFDLDGTLYPREAYVGQVDSVAFSGSVPPVGSDSNFGGVVSVTVRRL